MIHTYEFLTIAYFKLNKYYSGISYINHTAYYKSESAFAFSVLVRYITKSYLYKHVP